MRDEDGELVQREEGWLANCHEEGEQRCAKNDLRGGEWQEDEEAGRWSPAELIAHQRQRGECAEGCGEEGRDQRDANADDDRIEQARDCEEICPMVKREADPGVVRLSYRVVEAKEGNDEDWQQEIDEGQPRVGPKRIATKPTQHQPIPVSSSSVPSTRA